MEDVEKTFYYFYEDGDIRSYYLNFAFISNRDFTDVDITDINFVKGTEYETELVRKEKVKSEYQDVTYDGFLYVVLVTTKYNGKEESFDKITLSLDDIEAELKLSQSVRIGSFVYNLLTDIYFEVNVLYNPVNEFNITIQTVHGLEKVERLGSFIYSNNFFNYFLKDKLESYLSDPDKIFQEYNDSIQLYSAYSTVISKTIGFATTYSEDDKYYACYYYFNDAGMEISRNIVTDSFLTPWSS